LEGAFPDSTVEASTLPARADRRHRRRSLAVVGLAVALPVVLAVGIFSGGQAGRVSEVSLAPGSVGETGTAMRESSEPASPRPVVAGRSSPRAGAGPGVPDEPFAVQGVVTSVVADPGGASLLLDDVWSPVDGENGAGRQVSVDVDRDGPVVDVAGGPVAPESLDGHLLRAWSEGSPSLGHGVRASYVLDLGPISAACEGLAVEASMRPEIVLDVEVPDSDCSLDALALTRMLDAGIGMDGASFRVFLRREAPAGEEVMVPYKVPSDQRLAITGYVLQNPQGDTGELQLTVGLRVAVGEQLIDRGRLESFRSREEQYGTALIVGAGEDVTLVVRCENEEPLRCSSGVLVSGLIGTPVAAPGGLGRSGISSSLPIAEPAGDG
jgi:hypothetical protein